MKKFVKAFPLFLLSLPFASFVSAANDAPIDAPISVDTKFKTVADLMSFANQVINWIFTALIITAVVFILLAAFEFLTSGGDPAKTKTAQQRLLYAVIAIVIGALAKGLVLMVGNLLGVSMNF